MTEAQGKSREAKRVWPHIRGCEVWMLTVALGQSLRRQAFHSRSLLPSTTLEEMKVLNK